jgi:hypothetical protein
VTRRTHMTLRTYTVTKGQRSQPGPTVTVTDGQTLGDRYRPPASYPPCHCPRCTQRDTTGKATR